MKRLTINEHGYCALLPKTMYVVCRFYWETTDAIATFPKDVETERQKKHEGPKVFTYALCLFVSTVPLFRL